MRKYELSLGANYVQDWKLTDAVREFYQNAIDQETKDGTNKMFTHYDGVHMLQIGNKKSTLSERSLLLGASTKQGDDDTIGQFGEGYKIATLVALRLGKPVIIHNYGVGQIWKPKMVSSKKYDGAEILTFYILTKKRMEAYDNALIITVDNISPEEYEQIKQTVLWLQEDPVIITTNMGNILKEPRHKGQIFVNGLFVRNEPGMEYGYDIPPRYLKLDRDRKAVSSFDLQWYTSKMWAACGDPALVELVKTKAKDAQYLGSQTYVTVNPKISEIAHDDFREEFGDKAVPVTSQAELVHVQTSYKDAKPVLVTESQQKLVTTSPKYKVQAEEEVKITTEEKFIVWLKKVKDRLTDEECEEISILMELDYNNIHIREEL